MKDILPDFRVVTDIDEIQRIFISVGRSILLDHHLERGKYIWKIRALELYLHHPNWLDPTTHGVRFQSSEQLKSGTWYVHREGRLARKRLGIDITAGCAKQDIHCGLLLAAVGNEDGSGRAVKTILRGDCSSKDWKFSTREMELLTKEIHRAGVQEKTLRLVRNSDRPPLSGPF